MPQPKRKSPARKPARPNPKSGAKGPARGAQKGLDAAPTGRELTDQQNWREVLAIVCSGVGLLHFLALISYSPYDLPSWVPFSRVAGAADFASGNYIGPAGAIIAGFSYFLFGAACYLMPVVVMWFGAAALFGFRVMRWRTVAAGLAFLISASSLVDLQTIFFQDWVETYQLPRSDGGLSGYVFNQVFIGRLLGPIGGGVILSVVYLVSLIMITGFHPFEVFEVLKAELASLFARRAERSDDPWFEPNSSRPSIKLPRKKAVEPDEQLLTPSAKDLRRAAAAKAPPKPDPKQPELDLNPEPERPEPKIIDSNERKPRKASSGATTLGDTMGGSFGPTGDAFKNYQLPSLDLLAFDEDEESTPADKTELIETQQIIIDTLETFGVRVTPGDITRGPSITRYEVYPSKGLSVKKISTFEADLARATRAERINILAPIPGKDTVGIEIANSTRVLVPLRELFEDRSFLKGKAQIPLALGKDVYGKPVIADLASMPHLLVAGATGSGKSVCINSIIASLLFRFTPEELRFIMIDPKVVEMQIFNSLPHLAVPVVTDPRKVLLALRWCLNEMERRYAMFAQVGCRKLEEFNNRADRKARVPRGAAAAAARNAKKAASAKAKAPESATDTESEQESDSTPSNVVAGEFISGENVFMPVRKPKAEPVLAMAHAVVVKDDKDDPVAEAAAAEPEDDGLPARLPYVVVIIDELADLMQTAPADVETAIGRLCQKARAAGIHLIVATQSPRADVVTGLIKANIPARIAFQVSSAIDSRVILDKSGAEKLVGKGDMLYQPPDSPVQVRAQGAFLTEDEVIDIVDHCARQADPVFESDIQETLDGADGQSEVTPEDEEIVEKCLEVIMAERKASTSFLQRRLRLGYTRAARMMDILEERGIVGPGDGAKPREILVDLGEEIE